MSSSKVKVAVIGAGLMGTRHARVLSKIPEFELVAVADLNLWRAQLAAWKANTTPLRDYHDVFSRAEAVVIAVPTPLHFQVGIEALEKGLHCLIEKPLAASLDEARKLLALSQEKGLVLQVGHIERFNPAVIEAVKHVRDPRFITVERLGPYDPRMSHIGVVLDLMIHDLDILLTLVGSEVESIEAVGAHILSGQEDIANVRVRFKTGCIADLTASRVSLAKSRKLRLFQKECYISLDYGASDLKIYRKKSATIKSLKDVEILRPKLSSIEPLKSEHLHWLDCMNHHRKPWPSAERGIEALKLAFQVSEELERYRDDPQSASRSLVPEWARDLGRIARQIAKEALSKENS